VRADDAETIAYCAQFVGSVAEMLGDADLSRAARAGDGGVRLLDLIETRIERSVGGVRGVA
jgi:hypothetical protein